MGTLTDTGPLVALLDKAQHHHARCVATLPGIVMPFITTWPCFTESMYLLGRVAGWVGQDRLWQLVTSQRVQLHTATADELCRIRLLMERYRDVPMDVADASLVVAAETLRKRRIFTIDGDFHIYRLTDKESFEIIPEGKSSRRASLPAREGTKNSFEAQTPTSFEYRERARTGVTKSTRGRPPYWQVKTVLFADRYKAGTTSASTLSSTRRLRNPTSADRPGNRANRRSDFRCK